MKTVLHFHYKTRFHSKKMFSDPIRRMYYPKIVNIFCQIFKFFVSLLLY